MTPRAILLTLWTIIPLAACKDAASDDSDGPIVEDPECTDDEGCDDWEICEADECVPGDRNNGIDEAEPILWEQPAYGVIATEGDADYYSFNAEGGEFVRISTTRQPEDLETLDTVVSVYTPTGQLHHREDNHAIGRVNTYDTVLYTYLPDAGTWIVVVEDVNGAGDIDHAYELVVSETSAHTRETDAFDDPSMDQEIDGANVIWAIGVLLEEPGDADWIELELPYDDCPVYVQGSAYANGTDAIATAELYTADGQILMRKEGVGTDGAGAYFEVDGESAILSVTDALGGGGENYWTFVYISVDERGYEWPAEEEPNDLFDTANGLDTDWETNEWGNYGAALVWGTIDSATDEDWFYVEVDDGFYLTIRGSSDSLGSFLDASVEVYDASQTLLTSETDGSDNFADIYNFGPLDAGMYHVRVASELAITGGPQYYYRVSLSQSDYELAED